MAAQPFTILTEPEPMVIARGASDEEVELNLDMSREEVWEELGDRFKLDDISFEYAHDRRQTGYWRFIPSSTEEGVVTSLRSSEKGRGAFPGKLYYVNVEASDGDW